jgi:hypothetical protein
MVNRAIWSKNAFPKRVADSVTRPQSMRLFFVGLSQAESELSVAKNIGGSKIYNLTREIENFPAQML